MTYDGHKYDDSREKAIASESSATLPSLRTSKLEHWRFSVTRDEKPGYGDDPFGDFARTIDLIDKDIRNFEYDGSIHSAYFLRSMVNNAITSKENYAYACTERDKAEIIIRHDAGDPVPSEALEWALEETPLPQHYRECPKCHREF